MSLEAEIVALRQVVQELTRVVAEHSRIYTVSTSIDPQAATSGLIAHLQEDPGHGHASKLSVEDLPNDKPKSQPTPDTSPASSNESEPVTYDDVKRITIKVSEVSRDKAKAALSRFGVASAKALPADSWGGYVSYMGKVLSGEIDPEASHE